MIEAWVGGCPISSWSVKSDMSFPISRRSWMRGKFKLGIAKTVKVQVETAIGDPGE
jgi:hypothetical protein